MNRILISSLIFLSLLSILVIPQAFAQEIPSTAQLIGVKNGQDYSDTSYYDPNNPSSILHVWESHPPRLVDNSGNYNSPYFFTDNGNSYTISSGRGTYVYDKNQCDIKFYSPTRTPNSNNDVVNSISFYLQQTDDPNATSYTGNSINSAQCTTTKTDSGDMLKITGTRTNSDGTFVVEYFMLADEPMEYKASFYP